MAQRLKLLPPKHKVPSLMAIINIKCVAQAGTVADSVTDSGAAAGSVAGVVAGAGVVALAGVVAGMVWLLL